MGCIVNTHYVKTITSFKNYKIKKLAKIVNKVCAGIATQYTDLKLNFFETFIFYFYFRNYRPRSMTCPTNEHTSYKSDRFFSSAYPIKS